MSQFFRLLRVVCRSKERRREGVAPSGNMVACDVITHLEVRRFAPNRSFQKSSSVESLKAEVAELVPTAARVMTMPHVRIASSCFAVHTVKPQRACQTRLLG
jgi:hypothetical protein